jgi:acyl-CoA synthetase (AMP-forming)/AMP-acid ligase II
VKKHSLTDGSTLVEMLRRGSAEFGHAILYRFLQKGDIDGPVTEWSFRELDRRARIVALAIPGDVKPGQRAVLLYPPGLDFVSAFFGCMYRGLIAVPAYPPDPRRLDRSLPRLRSIAKDCSASVILTTEMIAQMGRSLTSLAPELGALRWTATDLAEGPMIDDADVSQVTSGDLAFLQYTSGSTGVPKGVCITHANILHNEAHRARVWFAEWYSCRRLVARLS